MENLGTPQFEEMFSNIVYVSSLKMEVGPSIPFGLVMRQSQVSLHQYAHPLIIVRVHPHSSGWAYTDLHHRATTV